MAEHENPSSTPEQKSCSSASTLNKQPQLPSFHGTPLLNYQMLQAMLPTLLPRAFDTQPIQEELNHGPGLYAVPVAPFMGQYTGFPPNTLIPFTYAVPTGPSIPENGAVGEEQGQMGQQQQQLGPQRQIVVRRFQIAFQLDLLLILKLAAVIFLFNQNGSRQRLILLVFLASLVYLYQTGALAPLIRWLSQGMQRAAAPPQPPRAAIRADNAPGAGRQGNDNVAAGEGQPGGENENQQGNDINRVGENEPALEPGAADGGNRWWGIAKEIQMIVFGFITSLLPGFHNID
ncbi:uncharacterized protein LOC107877826 isoform X2 [Capsicum annuum]|uniref:uncharacterized protein LOC107877826 isoform X2 n=1 Tax=Capsicum annuum TaxID=4072 RepID=UPI0007BED87D|nr:uncharacterized protein LOC107877826 isoform X2 [Capsicum annuum]